MQRKLYREIYLILEIEYKVRSNPFSLNVYISLSLDRVYWYSIFLYCYKMHIILNVILNVILIVMTFINLVISTVWGYFSCNWLHVYCNWLHTFCNWLHIFGNFNGKGIYIAKWLLLLYNRYWKEVK